jgi:phage shock protein A
MPERPRDGTGEQVKSPAAETRAHLKAFGVRVTDYEDRMRALRERARAGSLTAPQREALLRELAEHTATLHRALREITNHVYQLQSDALMDLVARVEPEV